MALTAESVTKLLNAAAAGDAASADELLLLIYDEMRALARARMRRSGRGIAASVAPTELVHEAYMRLFGDTGETHLPSWNSRGHFFAAAAQAMRNILVDQARQSASLKRGGGHHRQELGDQLAIQPLVQPPSEDVLALDQLLGQLEQSDPRKAKIVLLHCFSGLTLEEVAAAMDLSLSTIEREWRFTRALLRAQLEQAGEK